MISYLGVSIAWKVINRREMQMQDFLHDKKTREYVNYIWYIILGFCSFVRIVFSSGYNYNYVVNAGMDDQWMVRKAYYIYAHQWLGPYSHITLIKSVTYPVMLALFRKCNIPYGIAIGLLMIAISFVFARSIRPLVSSSFVRGVVYLLVLYSPVGFLSVTTGRIYRNSISHWLALFVIASFVGLFFRKEWSFIKSWKWIVCCSISLMLFWELREDKIWILALVLPASVIMLVFWLYHKRKIVLTILIALMPFICLVGMELGISYKNYQTYGVFTTNDRTGTYCGKVMSLLYKIDDGEKHRYDIWLSQGALAKAREVSPTLDSIGPHLDADWKFWLIDTEMGQEAPGDHAEWALRQSVMDAGYYREAVSTNEFYEKVYNELKDGFDRGLLKEKDGVTLSSQMKPVRASDFEMSSSLVFPIIYRYSVYDSPTGMYAGQTKYGMDENDIDLFESVLLTEINDYHSASDVINSDDFHEAEFLDGLSREYNLICFNLLWKVYKLLARVANVILIISLVLLIGNTIYEVHHKLYDSLNVLIVVGGLILVVLAYTLMLCLWITWITTSPDTEPFWFYGSPGPMMLQVIRILSIIYIGRWIIIRKMKNK